MLKRRVERKLYIPANSLIGDLSSKIREKLDHEMLNKCFQDYGYISKIYKKVRILNNVISNTDPGVHFDISFKVKSLLPNVGDEYTGTIGMIFPNGIVIDVENKLRIPILSDKLKGFVFVEKGMIFRNEASGAVLEKGIPIKVRITKVAYERQNFRCMAVII